MFAFNADRSFYFTRVAGLVGLVVGLTGCGASDDSIKPGYLPAGAAGLPASGAGGSTNPPGSGGSGAPQMGAGGAATAGAGGMGIPAMGGAGVSLGGTGGLGMGVGGMGGLGLAGMGPAGGGASGAGIGGMAGFAGMMAGAAGQGGAPPHVDLGVGTGTDVVLLGDSWMSNTLQIEGTGGGLAPSLIAAAGKPYRNYAVQGVMMLTSSAFGPAIPTQYDAAKRANPAIKTVVMTGGGNDIIQNPTIQSACNTGGAACVELLNKVSDAMNTLWTKMADDKVEDVVYVQYASDVGSTDPSVRGMQKTPAICTMGRIRCHAVDSTAAVMKQIAGDGIHPLQSANTRLAKVVYDLMKSEGMRR
jgi:hypothetical protein